MILDFLNLSSENTRRLNNIANSIRKPYTLFVDEYSKEFGNNYFFWATPFASRSIYNDSDTFLSLCRILLTIQMSSEISIEKVITANRAEKQVLKELLPKEIRIISSEKNWKKIKSRLISIIRCLLFCIKEILYIHYSKSYLQSEIIEHTSLLIMPVSSADFNGVHLIDRYFTGITDYREVIVLPYLSNEAKISEREFIYKIENCSNYSFLNGYHFLKIIDLFEIIRYWIFVGVIKKNRFVFKDMDISPLILNCLEEGKTNSPALRGILMRRILWRLSSQKNISVDNCLVWYEGRPNDVIISSSVRFFFPECHCVGYEDYPIPEDDLALCISEYQYLSNNCPNAMAIPSEAYEPLAHSFCSRIDLCYVPILRNEYELVEGSNRGESKKNILLVLPMYLGISMDIIREIDIFLQNTSYDCRILVKTHPGWNRHTLRKAGLDDIMYPFEVVNGDLKTYLRKANLVITSLSSSTLEIVYSGKPLLIVYPNGRLGYTALPGVLCEGLFQVVFMEELKDHIDYWLGEDGLDNSRMKGFLVDKNADTVGRMFV